MNGIRILAMGKALPKRSVDNHELSLTVDTSDEWIRTRTGISSRYICDGKRETCMHLAIDAAKDAVRKAGISVDDIGVIVVATVTSDYAFPSAASMVQAALGMDEAVMSFDLSAACTGFLYALGTARGLLHGQSKKYALVIGSEQLSRIVDFTDRETCVLFGDGAGAAVIELADKQFDQLCGTRGSKDVLMCPGTGSAHPYISMKGREVFRFAVTVLEQSIKDMLQRNHLTMDDIDYVVCHQANQRIIDHVSRRFPENADKFFVHMEHLGNTSAASIPLALAQLQETGAWHEGMKILCAGFGAGLNWSSILMEL